MNKGAISNFIKRNLWRIILFAIVLGFFIAILTLKKDSNFCEFLLARGFSRKYTSIISSLTSKLPFSVTECVVFLFVLFVIAFIILLIIFIAKKKFKPLFKMLYGVVTAALIIVTLSQYTYVGNFNRYPVISYLNLKDAKPSLENCMDASIYYSNLVNQLEKDLTFDENGNVISPYTFAELSSLINREMEKLDKEYFTPINVTAKPVIMSKVMSYFGITGVYFTFLGEPNVSRDIPTYQLPETIAHEIAHAKGVSRENEANYISYYTLITSNDPYLKYCGLMYASEKMLVESYDQNNKSYYNKAFSYFSDTTLTQYTNANAHWASYDSFLDDIGDFVNNLFLKSSGQPSGIKSYSETGVFFLRLYNTIKDAN